MRSRTEARRQHILEQAASVFREHGYDRASMAQIAAKVGGSKTTLYGYFPSKEELFAAVMTEGMNAQAMALVDLIDPQSDDPRPALTTFGRRYLDLILSPAIIKLTRIGVAESDEKIGAKLYALGPQQGWNEVGRHLQGWIDRGLLRAVPATVVALHLKGLLEVALLEPSLYGVEPPMSRDEAVERGVDAFLRAYGVDGPPLT